MSRDRRPAGRAQGDASGPAGMGAAPGGRALPVSLRGLTKRFDDVVAVHPLDLDVAAGELLVVLGPSGCGKSTVLRMIAGVAEPTSGEIRIGGEVVNEREPAERDVAMVFQNYALYPQMTVRGNLAFPLRMRGVRGDLLRARVAWVARMLELEPLLDRRPGQLSGGQRQRVALGRALVREPSVFLFDEPLSNLDARLRLEIRDLIASLHRRLGATMLFVTHDQVEAMSLGERIAVMRDGRLLQIGAPLEVYGEPANLFVARFIGSPPINLADGVLGHDGGGRVFMADGLTIAGASEGDDADAHDARPVTLAVRPEAIALVHADAAGAHVRRTVRRIEPLGSEVLVHVDGLGEDGETDAWIVRVAPDRAVRPGEVVGLRIDAERAHLFDAAGGARIGFLGTREADA